MIGSDTFLQRICRTVQAVCDSVIVVASAEQALPDLPPGVSVIRDPQPDQGPLAGLLTALQQVGPNADAVWLCACDTPLISPRLIKSVCQGLGDFDAAIVQHEGRRHPLLGTYRQGVHESASSLLTAGRRSLNSLLDCLNVRLLSPHELGVDLDELFNVNTPAELEALQRK